MKKHFFLTGYPRSRTCWAANLLSTGDAFCYHDALVDLDRLEAIRTMLEQPAVSMVGLSDPALLLFWKTLRLWYPEAKWIVIQRDLDEAYAASVQSFGPMRREFFSVLQHSLSELMADLQPLVIPFELTLPMARKLGEYLGIDLGPVQRIRQLMQTNVQVHNVRARMAHYKPPQFLLALG